MRVFYIKYVSDCPKSLFHFDGFIIYLDGRKTYKYRGFCRETVKMSSYWVCYLIPFMKSTNFRTTVGIKRGAYIS